ncbi:uncharacterized protein LOC123426686 isoform X3 [Hordeum vulgare subsp. vulgare]|uniref:uncharacterized protein LOC123426686 isoform X3 n=1 Tax=Hordeum vulgare subsp. vulgare TaxID=112509 RepID=UPI001D1A3358|nr:uncharacterized protein LOC123426686 isoform X3 [Hordeum vulgare subsp. vulgare]
MRTRSMASQPEPGPSTHGTAAPAPPPASVSASTHGTAAPAPPLASVSASTHGTAAPAPPTASASASIHGTAAPARPVHHATLQRCVTLIDWWLLRGQGGKICVTGYIDPIFRRKRSVRLFISSPITVRHAEGTLETADHRFVLTRGPLNIKKMDCNGFPSEVSNQFRLGFPIQWEKYVNSNMKQANEHTLSPEKSTEYSVEEFLCGSFANSLEHTLPGFDFRTSKESTGNADGPGLPNYVKPRVQEPFGNSGDYDNSMSNMAASEGLCNDRVGMPDESFEDPGPGDTCNGQASRADNSHEDTQTDASGKRIVSHSVDSALVSNDIDKIEEEHGPSKLGNNSVCPGTEHVLEVLNKVVSTEHGSVQCPKKLRSGKVYEMSDGASSKRGYSKRKAMQHEALSMKVIPNEETAPPAGPTSRKKGASVAQITALDKLQSHGPGRKDNTPS